MKKKQKLPLWLIVALIVAGGVLAFFQLRPKEAAVTYMTEVVRRDDIRRTVNASGEINAAQVVDVGAQASGQIERLHVDIGQNVKKGDLIAEIDSTTQENDLKTNRARLATYEAQLASRQVTMRVARAAYDRELQLKRSDSTSRQNLDDAENAWASAQAAVAEMESQIIQTQIAVNTAETNLGYTRITAPLDGTVVSVPVEEGQTVNAAQTTPTIVQVADLSRMEISIEIAEGDITKVSPGLLVEYSILSEPELTFLTQLHSLDPGPTSLSDSSAELSSGGSASAVYYYAKALVDNSQGRLRIGMTTQNVIEVESAQNVLLVPTIAITRLPVERPSGDQDTGLSSPPRVQRGLVRVLSPSGEVEEREVELGMSDNMNTAITSGLNEGEEVITTEMGRDEAAPSSARMRGMGR